THTHTHANYAKHTHPYTYHAHRRPLPAYRPPQRLTRSCLQPAPNKKKTFSPSFPCPLRHYCHLSLSLPFFLPGKKGKNKNKTKERVHIRVRKKN
ncbi:hypothetical protein COCSADRAFT_197670, partial [Bipolaris sorokiniana ND90Pr]